MKTKIQFKEITQEPDAGDYLTVRCPKCGTVWLRRDRGGEITYGRCAHGGMIGILPWNGDSPWDPISPSSAELREALKRSGNPKVETVLVCHYTFEIGCRGSWPCAVMFGLKS